VQLERGISVTGLSLLPTPVASDATTGRIIGRDDTYLIRPHALPRKINRMGQNGSVGLARLVKIEEAIRLGKMSREQPISISGRDVLRLTEGLGELNPEFAEWLLGYPTNWTALGH